MVKALLEMSRRTHKNVQILCLCYTNHALDAFLLDLIKSDAVPKADIVRVGGSKKVCESAKLIAVNIWLLVCRS
jgi:hypothetical protein